MEKKFTVCRLIYSQRFSKDFEILLKNLEEYMFIMKVSKLIFYMSL